VVKKTSSIFVSITFIFLIAASAILFSFVFFYLYDKEQFSKDFLKRYSIISKSTQYQLTFSSSVNELIKLLDEYNMEPINDVSKALNILNNTPIVYQHSSALGTSLILKDALGAYLFIYGPKFSILLKDKSFQPYRYLIFAAIFFIEFCAILFAYIAIIKKLRPLKELKYKIDKFAKGELDIDTKIQGNDEISDVANAFDNAVKKIKKLNNSRELFLRNIMHELKTPITKGRISAEMLEDGKNKKRLINTFERLLNLINEFAAIERLSSGFWIKHFTQFRLVDIIDEALDLAMVNKEFVLLDIEKEMNLRVDFKLFSIAIKNMIDNAIKYSPDNFVKIVADKKRIEFINKGEKLKNPLTYYLEPFCSEGGKKDSFGLGLYIVDQILKAHKLSLSYRHENGMNIFVFENIEIRCYNK